LIVTTWTWKIFTALRDGMSSTNNLDTMKKAARTLPLVKNLEAAALEFLTVQLNEFGTVILDMAVLAPIQMGDGKYGGLPRLKNTLDKICSDYQWSYIDHDTGEIQFYKKQ